MSSTARVSSNRTGVNATRNPLLLELSQGGVGWRYADRQNLAELNQHPPRCPKYLPDDRPSGSDGGSLGYTSYQFEQNSDTFPCMSYRPHLLGSFIPTACVVLPLFSSNHSYLLSCETSSPKLWAVVVPARHAYSHSASVGNRYLRPAACSALRADSFSQNSIASSQSIDSTGLCSPL